MRHTKLASHAPHCDLGALVRRQLQKLMDLTRRLHADLISLLSDLQYWLALIETFIEAAHQVWRR
jgi:hypothetical protein